MALIAGEVDFSIMSAFLLIPVSIQSGDVIMLGAFGRLCHHDPDIPF
jgi:hypothetical protein